MEEVVKRRSYVSPSRQARSEATRARILDAAAELFLADGYAGTSVRAVAKTAGVSEASVFAVFGSKARLLLQVIVDRVVRDDFPLRERTVWADLGPREVVAVLSGIVRRAHERSWRLLAIGAAAAQGDPELADAMDRGAERRWRDVEWLVREVFGISGPSLPKSTDAVWAVSSVDGYRRLVVERHWAPEDYEAWLARMLEAILVAA